MSDTLHSGQPSDFDEDLLNALIHADPHQTTRELASELGCDHATIVQHLQSMGKVQKLGVWVAHVLTQDNKNQRVTICASLLARQQHQSFLTPIITGNEKWCLCVNFKQRKEWLSLDKQATRRAKPDLHPHKTMSCIWWHMEGIVHYELLERNLTVTAERYCQQLRRLEEAIQPKNAQGQRHGVILHHDNARSHTGNMRKGAIQELDWGSLPDLSNFLDLARSHYYFFCSLSNNLRGVSFNNNAELQNWLNNFLTDNPADFFKRGIENPTEHWEAVMNNGGEYD
jgi:histone-lysine N-methyltransferase SETMAR